jgi:hypothetical protein
MIGLMFLVFFAVYFLVSFLVIKATMGWAKKRGRIRWGWGLLTAFLMYNLVFWDLIPTLALYNYKNNVEAGFWIYKTPEQWVIENQEAVKQLTYKDVSEMVHFEDGYIIHLNERIDSVNTESYPWLTIRKFETRIIDRKNGAVLVLETRFTSGDCRNSLSIKFWLNNCAPENHIGNLQDKYEKLGVKQ